MQTGCSLENTAYMYMYLASHCTRDAAYRYLSSPLVVSMHLPLTVLVALPSSFFDFAAASAAVAPGLGGRGGTFKVQQTQH